MTDRNLGSLAQRLPVAVFRTTPRGEIVAGNDALARVLGASRLDDVLGLDVRDLYLDPQRRAHMVDRVRAGQVVPPEEIQLRRLDDQAIWVRVTSLGVYGAAGDVEYFEGVLEDITEERLAAARLRSANRLLDAVTRVQTMFITGGDPGLVFDDLLAELLSLTDSRFGFIARHLVAEDGHSFLRSQAMTNIAWNDATRAMWDTHGPRGMEFHNLQTLFGRAITDATWIVANHPATDERRGGSPHGHPPLDSFLGIPVMRAGRVIGIAALANRPGGYDEPLVRYLEPVITAIGGLIEAVEREEALLAAEEREQVTEGLYRAVVEMAVEAVIVFDGDGRIELFNPAATRMTALDEADVIGRSVFELVPQHRSDDLGVLLRGASAGGVTDETELVGRSGQLVPVEVSVTSSLLGGRTIHTAVLRGIAQRKAADAALKEAMAAAERTNRAKDEFLAGMSHELRTPLNAVIGLSSILGRKTYGELNDKQTEYVDQIEASGRHLLALINDILDLAKIEAEKLEPELERIELASVVTETVALVRESALEKGLPIHIDVPGHLPDAWADRRWTKQVLVNLLSNAVKFTDSGGSISVEAGLDGPQVTVTVADTGIGIPSDRLTDIFAPFEQVDSSLARHHAGTGLGLALSRKLVEIQGGSIAVESAVGEGSRFTFRLPIAAGFEAPSPEARAVAVLPRSGVRRRVLVVEDNPVNRMLITDYLEAVGYETEVAGDGDAAVAAARSLDPDVILMDVQLPGRDGLSATRELKGDPATAGVPIVALTALAMKGDEERCLEAGCDAYLSKPIDPADVVATIERLLADSDGPAGN